MRSERRRPVSGGMAAVAAAVLLFAPAIASCAGTINVEVKAKGVKNAGDVVVYIDKIDGKEFPPPEAPAKMDQKNMTFIPYVLPVLKGTTVEFHNSDSVRHNVFTPDEIADKFNLGTWPQGEVRTYTFKRPGSAAMLCKVHPEMLAYVMVLETPYFAVTDKDGGCRIENVPAGKYTVKTWHEKLSVSEEKTEVPEEGEVPLKLELKR